MVCFPNAKINLGLNIISKREDGFHNIETIFYPIGLSDILEFIPSKTLNTTIQTTGVSLNIPDEENICFKAYQLLKQEYELPNLEIFLHKTIPSGAGLGGGSSDASFLLKELNNYFKLGINNVELESLAARLGSDCPFFIENKPVFAHGRGELFQKIELDLSDYYIYLVKPDVFVSTVEAYSGVQPQEPSKSLAELIKAPVIEWKDTIINDFELNIFRKHPLLSQIKESLYQQGAVYAAMSGSGSSLFGIFTEQPKINKKFSEHFNWISKL